MGRISWLLGLFLLCAVPPSIAAEAPVPQTARQALIEMFFGKAPGSLEKHLPEVTRKAIRNAQAGSSASMLSSFATLASVAQTNGQQLQTFETGPTLLTFEYPQQHSRIEVLVERDDLQADEDDIEVSFRATKDGETQTVGMKPRLTFAMKQEAGIWRLNQVTVAVSMSLTDPELLKAITTPMKPPVTAANSTSVQPVSTWSANRAGNEASAASSVRALTNAQSTYAALYPAHGYTCSLSDLGGMGGTERNEHQAMLVDPRLANGKKNGYVFALSSCGGNPASTFNVTAAPAETGLGMKTFCSDQSGVIRFSLDPNPASCLSTGKPLQ